MFVNFRNSRKAKAIAIVLSYSFILDLVFPTITYGIGGPDTPEATAFTPAGVTNMVDPFTGAFSYNIPLLDIGGYPINIAYSGSPNMEQEASWVGLGWNINPGAINRQKRGMPDDFKGDLVHEEMNMRPNQTFATSVALGGEAFGFDFGGANVNIGFKLNNYDGFGITSGAGVSLSASEGAASGSLGVQFTNSPDGLDINPNASFSVKVDKETKKMNAMAGGSLGIGAAFNTRQGLKAVNVSASVSGGGGSKKVPSSHIGGATSTGGVVSLIDNTYMPSYKFPHVNGSFSGTFKYGAGAYGGDVDFTFQGSFSSQGLATKSRTTPAYGYFHEEKANNEDNVLMDFNREKERPFSRTMPFLHTANHTYDLYSVSGQGVSGMFRAFRNEAGYVHDPRVKDITGGGRLGLEYNGGGLIDVGISGGVNVNEGESGIWKDDNEALHDLKYREKEKNKLFEPYYFRNVGEPSVDEEMQSTSSFLAQNGGFDPVRLAVDVNGYSSIARSKYVDKQGQAYPLNTINSRNKRAKRNQVITSLTKSEVQALKPNQYTAAASPAHHISEMQIIQNDGMRYIYDIPAFNLTEEDVSFNVSDMAHTKNFQTGLVSYTPGQHNTTANGAGRDHFFNRIVTPAYAHAYLLGAALSPDYVDSDGVLGPTPDDYGSYTRFYYGKESNGKRVPNVGSYKWRVPFDEGKANYSEGMKVDKGDDRGNYSYGAKELWYVEKIESKTHVALFHLSGRRDGFGVKGPNGGRATDETKTSKKLDRISLYSRPEYEKMKVSSSYQAVPIKTVHFEYDYSLCGNVPSNDGKAIDKDGNLVSSSDPTNINKKKGKLTLRKIYFTYQNSHKGVKNDYQFIYGDRDHNNSTDENPDYNMKAMTPWGTYQENKATVQNLAAHPATNQEFPYINQNKEEQDKNVASWRLTDIYLPTGGKISVDYESNDYAFVQDKPALRMFKILGMSRLGPGNYTTTKVEDLPHKFYNTDPALGANDYLYFEIPQGLTAQQVDYMFQPLKEKEDMYFRVFADLTSELDPDDISYEYVEGYLADQHIADNSWGTAQMLNNNGDPIKVGYLKVNKVHKGNDAPSVPNPKEHPMSKAVWQFARMNAPRRAFDQPDPQDGNALFDVLKALGSQVQNVMEFFTGPNGRLRAKSYGRDFKPYKSWIRLQEPTKRKLGGGARVKKIEIKDRWGDMIGDPDRNFSYGQEYIYEMPDGTSSGVAAYEPMGTKENPLIKPFRYSIDHLLAPNENHYVEAPLGESFFPSPSVGYRRVITKSLTRKAPNGNAYSLKRHGTGHVEHLFYTSYDYPTRVDFTDIYAREKKANIGEQMLKLNVRNYATASQGFVVETNDMHGKPKGSYVYAEGQSDYISGQTFVYDHHPVTFNQNAPGGLFSTFEQHQTKLDNNVPVIYPDGTIQKKQIGVDFDIINDFRESKTQSVDVGADVNFASFMVGIIPMIIPTVFPDVNVQKTRYRSVSTMKVINRFGILREVVAHDKGASVSTRNLAWDSETGEVLLTETMNEYGDKYYSLNYPVHWAYEGMGQAYQNIAAAYDVNVANTGIMTSLVGPISNVKAVFTPGDEVVHNDGSTWKHYWVSKDYKLLDKDGATYIPTGPQVGAPMLLSVMRSGHRNMHARAMGSIVTKVNPIDKDNNGLDAQIPLLKSAADQATYGVIDASAQAYSDDWPMDYCNCDFNPEDNPTFNPYLTNSKGCWRELAAYKYLDSDQTKRKRTQTASQPNLRYDGVYTTFKPFWYYTTGTGWSNTSNVNTNNWISTQEATKHSPYGFMLETEDALKRYSASQLNYNHMFVTGVSNNARYQQIGSDNFEEYHFDNCSNDHFSFEKGVENSNGAAVITRERSHTGRYSIKVSAGKEVKMRKRLESCNQ